MRSVRNVHTIPWKYMLANAKTTGTLTADTAPSDERRGLPRFVFVPEPPAKSGLSAHSNFEPSSSSLTVAFPDDERSRSPIFFNISKNVHFLVCLDLFPIHRSLSTGQNRTYPASHYVFYGGMPPFNIGDD